MVMKPYPIPVAGTTYVDFFFNLPEDLPDLFHIVMGEVINSQPLHLHHFTVDGCTEKVDESIEGMPMSYENFRGATSSCNIINIGAWAPGANIFSNVDLNMGVLSGKRIGIKALRMNVHYTDGVYDDPETKTLKMATDGFRVHYTTDFRPYSLQQKHLVAVVEAVDELVVPAGESRFFVTRTCKVSTSCKDYTPEMIKDIAFYFDSVALAAGGITCQEAKQYCNEDSAVGEHIQRMCPESCGFCGEVEGGINLLNPGSYHAAAIHYHAHLLGREMYATLIREEDSEIIVKDMKSMPFWISDFQETNALSDGTNPDRRGFEIKPGDKIQVTCVYDGSARDNDTNFGLATTDEMCVTSVAVSFETPEYLLYPNANASSIVPHANLSLENNFLLRNFFCDSGEEFGVYTGVLADGEDGREIWKNHPISTAEGCIFPADDWHKDLKRNPPICPTTDTSDMDSDSSSDNEDSGDLVFVPFEPYFPCADGSPAGLYREANGNASSERDHIIVFLGGGACTSEENCKEMMERVPFLFSSDSLPQSLQGHTILSRNGTDNIVSSDFTRWVVPYCTQDLFLGSNRFSMKWGSGIVEAALTTLKNSFNDSPPNTLIVAGISAGAIGLMNHIESVQKLSRDVNATNLRLILDSVSLASTMENAQEIQSGVEAFTDFEKFPLCASSYTQAFQPTELWNVPCCISIHCMLENDPVLQRWAQADTDGGKERLLILDSLYDLLAIVSTKSTDSVELSDTPSMSDIDSFVTRVSETGGARGQQFKQSAYGSQTRLGKSILWTVTNVANHGFLLPALEIEQLRCGTSRDGGDDIDYVCNHNGVGIRGELFDGLDLTAWLTTESWHLITVNGESVRDIIRGFVYNETITHGLVRDVCSGPNCVPTGATEPNPAQKFFVLNDDFTSISLWAEILLLITAGCLILTYVLRVLKVDLKKSNSDETPATAMNGTIKINNISVNIEDTEKEVLNDVSFSLPPGTITALLGPSGSGKSTLLNVLCGQLPDGLQGFQRDEAFESLGLQSSYLRQFGNSSFQNIELMAYLKLTARLYGASESELEMVVNFLKKSFADRVGEGPNFGGIRIKELSGGQQRTVAIVATMLTKPKLLLLDEPLSGLDSVSSLMILKFMRDLAKDRSCAILLTLHQPSDAILERIDKSLVLHGGSLVLNQKVESSTMIHDILENLANGREIERPRRLSLLQKSMTSMASMRRGSIVDSMRRRESKVSFRGSISVVGDTSEFLVGDTSEFLGYKSKRRLSGSSEKSEVNQDSASRCRMKFDLWQIQPLMRRLQLEIGHDYRKMFELALAYSIICGLLQFKERLGPVDIIIAISLFCCSPVFIFQPLLLRSCISYNDHQLELQDGRISPSAYMLASFFFFTSMPVAAIAVGIAIGYGILGWDFGTYPDQFLLASLFFLVTHQLGRAVVIYMDGFYPKVDFIYVVYTAASLVLSGVMVSPNELPVYIRWLTFLSVGWWSISGTVLVHLEQGSLFDESDICSSLQTCILQDGVFLARSLGYTPIGSTRLSYVVLLLMFVALFSAEYVLMVRKYGSKRQF